MFQNKIQKRTGEIVSFDPQKISLAINKAMLATGVSPKNGTLKKLTDDVVLQLQSNFSNGILPSVENAQDLVEKSLMKNGYFDTAKAYILYRRDHDQVREQAKTIQEKLSQHDLKVIKRDGNIEIFDEQKLRTQIIKYAQGLGQLTQLDSMVKQILSTLRDNISTREISQLIYLASKTYIETDPQYDKLTARAFLGHLYKEIFSTRFKYGQLDRVYEKTFVDNIKFLVKEKRLDKRLLRFNLKKLSQALVIDRDELFTYRGLQTLYDRYFIYHKDTGQRLETPQGFWMRVAMGLAIEEKDRDAKALQFYEVLSTLRFVSSTPTLFQSGTTYPQLSSCYLMTVNDDLLDIFKNFSDHAQLSKWSGGIGTDWSSVRATGAHIKTSGVESQGVIPFLRISNDTTVAINRSGKRRGAAAVYLETWHYDIEDFLDLKRNTGDERRRTHDMNTVNWIPDLFMKRVEANASWSLFSPDEVPELHHLYGRAFDTKYIEYEQAAREGKIKLFKEIKASDLWKKMITRLFETGHPWITFKDPSNIRSPQDHVGVVHNSNLCTEITLNTSKEETAVCNLGSLNLARHIKKGKLDTKLLAATVETGMRMLDNVIDINFYPIREAKISNMRHRPVGLGIMGFQDALYLQDINFDSEKAVQFADESMELISYHAILTSSRLAKEKGAYSTFKGSKWDRGYLPQDTIKLLEEERGIKTGVEFKGKLDWQPVRDHIKSYGMRNSNCMAIAPTATISNISGCFPAIEAIYKNLYVKANMSGDFTVDNHYLIEDLKSLGLWSAALLEKIKANDGSIKNIAEIPTRLKEKYKESFDLDPRWSIKQAAYRGKWIDQSQSLNIFSSSTSGKELSDIYFYAWKSGLKTTYYLRTMGASSIEKSTVSIGSAFSQNSTVPSEALVSAIVETAPEAIAMAIPVEVKACKIDNPDCEACQ